MKILDVIKQWKISYLRRILWGLKYNFLKIILTGKSKFLIRGEENRLAIHGSAMLGTAVMPQTLPLYLDMQKNMIRIAQ